MVLKKFTIIAWYNPGPNQPEVKQDVIVTVTKYPHSDGFSFWSSWSKPNDLKLGMVLDGPRWIGIESPEGTLGINEWSCIGTTYDGDTGKKHFILKALIIILLY